ncbi:MAG: ABC transporter permease, partial [Holophagales bacterium]|nr:ABC transporter permease [Holophagales bacterium]
SLRSLRQRPAFTLTVIGILAFGIGATTTVWSVVDAVLLRALPYPDAERLVVFEQGSHPWPFYEALAQTRSFESLAGAWFGETADLTGHGKPLQLASTAVTPGFLELFGARAIEGRLLRDEDYLPGGKNVLISAGLWQRQWGRDRELIGDSILLDGEPHTVVGVLEPGFRDPEGLAREPVDVWRPLDESAHPEMTSWNFRVLELVARLHPGISRSAADAEVEALNIALAEEHDARRSGDGSHRSSPLVSLHQATVGRVSGSLWILLGAVGFLLVIACVNVANLSLARGGERRRELALRSALGAGRQRLVRQMMVESSILAVAGGVLGVVLAYGGVALLDLLRPGGFPRFAEVAIDPRVLGFALGLSLATGVVFGLLPALRASRTDLRDTLAEGAASTTASGGRLRARGALVVAEVALAVVLVFGAGLLFHSLVRMVSNEPGFDPDGLLRIRLRLAGGFLASGDPAELNRSDRARELIEAAQRVPGVEAASATWVLPFDYYGSSRCCWASELRLTADSEAIDAYFHPVTPEYFEVLGARLLRGRELDWTDGLPLFGEPLLQVPADAAGPALPTPVVLNRSLAELLEAEGLEGDPLGARLLMGTGPQYRIFEVVGLVDDLRQYGFQIEPSPTAYLPYGRDGRQIPYLSLAVRTSLPLTEALANDLRKALWSVAPDLPVPEITTFRQQMSRSVAEPRFLTTILGTFAGLSLLLAAAGLYGSLLYSVGQRRREMGIRLALGARSADLQRLVLGQGLGLTLLGLALGSAGALAAARVLESQVYGITPRDPTTLAATAGALFLAALAACWLPSRRAARTDPLTTLRAE